MSEPSEQEKLIAKQLEELSQMVASLKEAAAPIESQFQELGNEEHRIRQQYEFEIAKIREQKKSINEQLSEFNKKANQASWEIQRQQRELKRLEDERKRQELEKERAEKMAVMAEEWDMLTAGATWREMAKEHQIQAGHYITENRNVILADPMGLGKTLSSIIVCDMAQKATIHANSDMPFLGEVKEVYNSETSGYDLKVVGGINRPVGNRILYFCPASLIRNVQKEFRMWAQHRNVIFIGGMSKAYDFLQGD